MTGVPVETQEQFDTRVAAGRAFRDSPAGRQLAAGGARILDALERVYAEEDTMPEDDQPAAELPAEDVAGTVDALEDGLAPDDKPWAGKPLRVDVPAEELQPVTDQPGPVEPVGQLAHDVGPADL